MIRPTIEDRAPGPRPHRARHTGLVIVLVAIVLASVVAFRVSASNSLPGPGWAATVNGHGPDSTVSDLLDGGTVGVNLAANSDVPIYSVTIRECRLGATYATPADLGARAGNCPPIPVSSSADLVVQKSASDGLITLAQADGGYTINFHVGIGTAEWDTPTGKASLECGVGAACALVALVEVGQAEHYVSQVFTIDFKNDDPLLACGGTAPGVLKAAASDELADAWANWTRDYCAKHPGGAPSTTSFSSEGEAVTGFEAGNLDVAYGSAGTDPATGMVPAGSARDTIAVPLGLNAAVLAVGGGHRTLVNGQPVGDKVAYPQLEMTVADAAAVLANGRPILQDTRYQYAASVVNQNPALNGIAYRTGSEVLAPSSPLTTTWLLTNYFATVTPSEWVDRRSDPPVARSVTSALGTAVPDFQNIVQTTTGRPSFLKVTFPASIADPDGPLWVYTDRVTAAALKLTPVKLQDATGVNFVAPDEGSMTAAVADMKPNAAGVLQPDIRAAIASDGAAAAAAGAYPLTYVEYAFVPAEQLVDPATCSARTTSQTLLTNWLQYVTGDGQQNLPAGMVSLPDSLKSEAAAAIAKVGASPTTGACAGRVTPETTPGGATTGATGGPTGAALPGAQTFKNVTQPPNAAAANQAAQSATDQQKAAAIAIPAFAGRTLADPLGGVVALVGIVLVMSLAAWITAGGNLASGAQWSPGALGALTPRRIGSLALLWGGVGIAGLGLVLFQLGPLLAQREQRSLLSEYKREVSRAAYETQGLGGATDATTAPAHGDPVGILEIGSIKVQNVVVEGVTPSQTRDGPGHVPGTSGLGQPGNSVVVGRRNGYGGVFAGLGALVRGDRIVVTTTQGQSVYSVECINQETIEQPSNDEGSSSSSLSSTSSSTTAKDPCAPSKSGSGSEAPAPGASTTTSPGETTTSAGASSTTTTTAKNGTAAGSPTRDTALATSTRTAESSSSRRSFATTIDALYGSSSGDQLTLVTSATKSPFNTNDATVVVAKLMSKPFPPTNQNGRNDSEIGKQGDDGALAVVILSLLAFVGVIAASVALYRKMRFRIAYVLTIAPLVALTIITGEALARLLPAWT